MGRSKRELKRIHQKKIRRAKARVRAYSKGELPKEKLTSLAKKLLRKKREVKKTA